MRRFLQALVREPLLHFALLGGLLYVGYVLTHPPPPDKIVVPQELIAARQIDLQKRLGRKPSEAELHSAALEYVESEILYREAVRRRLGEGDIIIRRRLTQKMEYLAEALVTKSAPTEADLHALMEAHPERYRLPPRIALRQVFVRFPQHNTDAREKAAGLLERLRNGQSAEGLGDPHPLGGTLPLHSEAELAQLFSSSFAAEAFRLPAGGWSGPIASAHGLHLLQITGQKEGGLPSLDSLRERLLLDHAEEVRPAQRKKAMDALSRRYQIVWPGRS